MLLCFFCVVIVYVYAIFLACKNVNLINLKKNSVQYLKLLWASYFGSAFNSYKIKQKSHATSGNTGPSCSKRR